VLWEEKVTFLDLFFIYKGEEWYSCSFFQLIFVSIFTQFVIERKENVGGNNCLYRSFKSSDRSF